MTTHATLPRDPLEPGGIEDFGRRLRTGRTTAEAAVRAYLDRIEALDPRLGAFEHVAAEQALAAGRAIDGLVAAGTDLGPLMGVPVAVKDLFAVDGMPTTAGSRVDVTDLVGDEGGFVKALKRAGCIVLGKTKTVEFAFGAAGVNTVRGTPWNPWDAETHRLPGGSSSGSAVAVAAGLAAFATGTDTGGSIRVPAAFCGVFGLKTTVGRWPTDGLFPLSPTLDSIGLLTRSANDAAIAYAALTNAAPPRARPLAGLRLGKPESYFFGELEPEIEARMTALLDELRGAGVELVPIDLSEASERMSFFPTVLAVDLIATLGRDRYLAARGKMDPVVATRTERGLDTDADEYCRQLRRHHELRRIVADRMVGLDGFVSPAATMRPPPLQRFNDVRDGLQLAAAIPRNTQPGNLFGSCGLSMPIQGGEGSQLPIGCQVLCSPGQDRAALSLALALEARLGPPILPDVSRFS